MMTWPLIWAPQWHLHFPFSGSVAQDIDPDVNWFFAGIRPQAGNKEIERKAFDIASYGRATGLNHRSVTGYGSHQPATYLARTTIVATSASYSSANSLT